MAHPQSARLRPVTLAATAALILSACGRSDGFDLDLRGRLGDAFDTAPAAQQASVVPRPDPDSRGVITYPTYQVAVARDGDTVQTIAQRLDLPATEIARFNGLPETAVLRRGEIVALPSRVDEPTRPGKLPSSGTVTTTSIEDRASAAIDRSTVTPGPSSGPEPGRHRVAAGETAFAIARQYGVPVRAIADWNGLGEDLTVREGQVLLIPPTDGRPAPQAETAPGEGTVAPPPPSAARPLPEDDTATVAPPENVPESPDLASEATESSAVEARMVLPVQGPIVRDFDKGTNDGIDIAAEPGTPVRAADGGSVAAITRDTDQVPIVVLRHTGNLLTVYAGVENVTVDKGDSVERGQTIAQIRGASPSILHFEVRDGFDSVDPSDYLP